MSGAEISPVNPLRHSLAGEATLVMPNVWDVGSARIAREQGFQVIGTSSAAIAAMLGGDDAEGTAREEMLDWAGRIVRTAAPAGVNVDIESGYGLSPAQIADVVRDLDCAGINLEDTDHATHRQLDPDVQAARLEELVALLAPLPRHPVLTARVDSMLDVLHDHGLGDSAQADARVGECIERAHAYLRAGADVVFPIGLNTPRQMRRFLAHVPARRTALLVPFLDRRLDVVRGFGVSRISFGGSPREATDDVLRRRLRQVGADPGPIRRLTRAAGRTLGSALRPQAPG